MSTLDSSLASKEAVLTAARSLLLQHGYAGLSMRELAKQSGLAKGTIYHHFHDKRAIYLSVLERDLAIARDRIQSAAAGQDDPIQRLHRVICTYFQLQQEHRLIILLALRDTAGLEAKLCALIRRYRDELLQPIEAVFADAIAAGVMRPLHIEMTVMSLLGMLQSYVGHRVLLDELQIGGEVVDHVLDLLLHGVLMHDDAADPMHDTQIE